MRIRLHEGAEFDLKHLIGLRTLLEEHSGRLKSSMAVGDLVDRHAVLRQIRDELIINLRKQFEVIFEEEGWQRPRGGSSTSSQS